MAKQLQGAMDLSNAEQIYDTAAVADALKNMAGQINMRLAGESPLVLVVMTGGIVPAGILLPQLHFPLRLDYIHASRYQGKVDGGVIQWLKKPTQSFAGETVLLIDDILDQGVTLSHIIAYCKRRNANNVYTAVLAQKDRTRTKTLKNADFIGLIVPNRYVFGYGMDYREYHRNCAGIYALKESCEA